MLDAILPAHARVHTLIARLGSLWRWLTEPLVSLPAFEDRLKSRWLAGLLLCLMPIGVVLSGWPDPLATMTSPQGLVQLLLILAFVPLYFMSRLGHYKLASALAVLAGILAVWTAIFQDADNPTRSFDAAMLLMPLLFGSIMFSRKATLFVSFVAFLSLLSMPLTLRTISYADIVSGPFNVVFIGACLSLLGMLLRDRLEQQHVSTLTAANQALSSEIAERGRAEARLRESNERYQAVVMQTTA